MRIFLFHEPNIRLKKRTMVQEGLWCLFFRRFQCYEKFLGLVFFYCVVVANIKKKKIRDFIEREK